MSEKRCTTHSICDCLKAKMERQEKAIKAAMDELENYPNIGEYGPRLSGLRRVEKHGHVYDNLEYHVLQKTWRILENS